MVRERHPQAISCRSQNVGHRFRAEALAQVMCLPVQTQYSIAGGNMAGLHHRKTRRATAPDSGRQGVSG